MGEITSKNGRVLCAHGTGKTYRSYGKNGSQGPGQGVFTYMAKPERHHSLVKMFANKPWLENIGSSTILVRQLSGEKTIFRMYTQLDRFLPLLSGGGSGMSTIYLSDQQNVIQQNPVL